MSNKGCCRECKYAEWDADGCTCRIDGRSVYNASAYTCDQYRPAKPLANADRIRKMTDEELAYIMQGRCACCAYQLTGCTEKECIDGVYEWLKQEVIEDAGSNID